MSDDQISSFSDITGAAAHVARGYLEVAGGDVEQAIQLYFENPELANSFSADASQPPPVPSHTRPTVAAVAGRGRVDIGREDASGVIHLDSDDDADTHMTLDDDDEIEIPDDDEDDAVHARVVARAAQEDEDAAMAKRLQEELYSEPTGIDGVRSPIARTTETLIAPNPAAWNADDDDMEAAIMEQMSRRRQAAQPRLANPFSQSMWEDPERRAAAAAAAASSSAGENGSRAARLVELFRPPYDLMSNMTWDEARAEGKEEKKWIIVNLQDMSDFHCQALNRDIWKHPGIKELVQQHFIFIQHSKDDLRARQYIQFYFPNQTHENPDIYPHVSIVDPRTGEQVKVWSGKPFPDPADFLSQLAEFLDRYSLAANSKNPVAKTSAPRAKVVDVDRMTEEEMLEMALQNSLETQNGSRSTGGARSTVVDPDSFTKSPAMARREPPEGKGKAVEVEPEAEPEQATWSAFDGISKSVPHEEPANDPKSTTRIQFKHANGRVIRRFSLQDSVRRIYEWLKAEPLEGKDGLRFELRRMPQAKDLLEDLDKTIEEAGLKQGTVMVDFVDD